jgi:hypothetical protein
MRGQFSVMMADGFVDGKPKNLPHFRDILAEVAVSSAAVAFHGGV